jgi:O-glycosyl hydrolase
MKKIFTVLLFLSTCLGWAQTSTVNLTSVKQYIRGFGGINVPEWAGDLTAAQRTTAYGNGAGQMGLTVLRVFVNDDKTQWNRALATAKYAQAQGATVFATPWNPPASMCETVSRNGRQEKRLKYASYADYAQHLIDFNNYMKTNGVNLYAMSFANEPDWGFDWTWYSQDEVYNFTLSQAAKLRVNGIKVITAESFSYNKSYYDKVLNDPNALANIDIIGCHLYGSSATSPVSVYNYPLADQKAPTKERWMTEHYTNSDNNSADIWPDANDVSYEIYRCMVEGQMSVYTWWYIRRQYSPMKEDGTISKRGYCMAQYTKFIRPGYNRIDATKNPTTDVYISAYKKVDDVVVVAINRSTSSKTITISVPGTKVITWETYVTSGSKSLAKGSNINSSTGSFQVTLDPQSTTSFVGTAAGGGQQSVNPVINITAPTNNAVYTEGNNVTLTANATITTGSISKVDFYNGTTLLGTDASSPYSYTMNAVTVGTYTITAIATSAANATTTSTVITFQVLPAAPTVIATPTYCQNYTASQLSATGIALKWYTSGTGGIGVTTAPTPSTTNTGTINYYVSQTKNGLESDRAMIVLTVNAAPSSPAVTGTQTYCQNGTATALTATGTGLLWYTAATGGTGSTTAPIPSTATTGTTNYYVSQTTTGCESSRSMIAVTVTNTATASITTTSPTAFCTGGSVVLTASAGTSYKWFNGTTQVGTAATYSATTAGSYTVEVTNGGNCKATSSATNVMVNAIPAAPTVAATATYCQNGTATALSAIGTGLKWYTAATGGTGSTTAPTPSTATTGATNYYVSQTTTGCESARAMIAVTVTNTATASITTTSPTAFCTGGSVVLTASVGTSYKWFNGSTQVGTAATYSATTAGSYTVEVTNGGNCKATSSATNVTVNAAPSSPAVTGTQTYCQNGTATALSATGAGLLWYIAATGGTGSTTAPIPTTATTGTTNYYVSQTTTGCESSRSMIAVTVTNTATASITTTAPTAFCTGGSVVLTASAGTSYKWFNGSTQVGTAATYSATTAGSYTVEVTNGGNCKATSSATNVTINAIPSAPTVAATATYCQNGTAIAFFATGTGLKWYTAATGGTGSTTAPTPSTATIGTTNYYVSQTTTGCESSRATIAVTVNALPVATITAGSSTNLPQGGSVVLTASAGSSYIWFKGTAQVGTDASYTATTPGAYSVQVTNASNCSVTSSATNVNINSNQPSVITITSPTNNSTVQGAITITATVTDPDGGIVLVEYLDGNTVIGTSTSAPYSFVWNTPTAGDHDITVRVTDSNGGITTSAPITITSESTTTTTGLLSGTSASLYGVVYPNPSNGAVFIDSDSDLSDASFMLVDVLGNEHDISHTGTGLSTQIDVRNLSSGTYVLIIKKNDSVMRKKITVMK